MNVIPRTFLANSVYQRCVNQYSRVAKEIKVTIPDTVLSRAFSCVTHIDNAKCNESVYLTQTKQISTTNTSNIKSDKLSGYSSGLIKKATFNSADNSFCKILRRQVWKNHGPADSGLGHSWPSRLGRVKTKKQREHGVDILDDNEDKIKAEEIINKVNTQIAQNSYGRLFAVVLMEKHQHKITAGDLLMCNHDIGASLGQVIKLDKSLLIGGKDFTLVGRPFLPRDSFKIMATVVEKNLSQHKVCYRQHKRVKSNNPKTRWHRDHTTTLRINSIELVKPVDKTIDRAGFEKPLNINPLSGIE